MTAKRFEVEKNDKWICILDNGESIGNIYDVCGMLNNLHEENEQLHDEIFRLRTIMAYDRTVDSIFDGMAKIQREQMYPLKEEGKQYRS